MSQTAPQVAPQFISTLQDQAEERLVSILQELNAPAETIELVYCLRILGSYQEFQVNKPAERFIGIEDVTLQTINLLFQDKKVFVA